MSLTLKSVHLEKIAGLTLVDLTRRTVGFILGGIEDDDYIMKMPFKVRNEAHNNELDFLTNAQTFKETSLHAETNKLDIIGIFFSYFEEDLTALQALMKLKPYAVPGYKYLVFPIKKTDRSIGDISLYEWDMENQEFVLAKIDIKE